jgi:hypothetical protein
MKPSFEFYNLPREIKNIIYSKKNRDITIHKRRTRWMHHELSTRQFFCPITREDVSMCEFPKCGPFMCWSDLFERQDSDDLNLFDFGGDHGDLILFGGELFEDS